MRHGMHGVPLVDLNLINPPKVPHSFLLLTDKIGQ